MVINMKLQNQALLMKHLHKFYVKLDIPRVHLMWNTYYGIGQVPHFTLERRVLLVEGILHISISLQRDCHSNGRRW